MLLAVLVTPFEVVVTQYIRIRTFIGCPSLLQMTGECLTGAACQAVGCVEMYLISSLSGLSVFEIMNKFLVLSSQTSFAFCIKWGGYA